MKLSTVRLSKFALEIIKRNEILTLLFEQG